MDVRMSNLPATGCGNSRYFTGKGTKSIVSPQVTLTMNSTVPILDTRGMKSSHSKSSSGTYGSNKSWGGQLLTTFRKACNSFMNSSPPITWVNPCMVPQYHPSNLYGYQQNIPYQVAESKQNIPYQVAGSKQNIPYQVAGSKQNIPYQVAGSICNQDSPLWYQATPGSQYYYQDPIEALSYQYSDMNMSLDPRLIIPDKKEMPKVSRPLNPEAKEWVPRNFKSNKGSESSIPSASFQDQQDPIIVQFTEITDKEIPSASFQDQQDPIIVQFTEITDKEIDAVRKENGNAAVKRFNDCVYNSVSEAELNEVNLSKHKDLDEVDRKAQSRSLDEVSNPTEIKKAELAKEMNASVRSLDEVSNPTEIKKAELAKEMNASVLSYANVAKKTSKLTSDDDDIVLEKDRSSPKHLPKIFIKDKKYPKEKAPQLKDNRKSDPMPFRTASRTQKRTSRKFLKELRDNSPAESISSHSENEGSLDISPDLKLRLCMGSSQSLEISPNGTSCNSPNVSTSSSVQSQRSVSESSDNGSYKRTVSESSTGSVDSVDIEFTDCDVPNDACLVSGKSKPKCTNSILSHILGLDESDSEASDDSDDDDDWDTLDCERTGLDESWETLGFAIPVITKSLPIDTKVQGGEDRERTFDNDCDSGYSSCDLEDVNKRWEAEVECNVTGSPKPTRVQFGIVTVHPMITWSFAYKNARRGPWEQYARDRARFSNRISSVGSVLAPVLNKCHRDKMYCKIYGC